MLDDCLGSSTLATSHGADPCGKLGEIERLDDVVVSTGVEALHAIGDRIPGRQHEHRQHRAALAQPAQDREAFLPRQAEIQQAGIVRLGQQRLFGRNAVPDPVNGEALPPQTGTHRVADHGVVLRKEQSHDLFQNFILSVRSAKNFFGRFQIADATDAAPSRTMVPSNGSACTAALRRMPLRSPSLR